MGLLLGFCSAFSPEISAGARFGLLEVVGLGFRSLLGMSHVRTLAVVGDHNLVHRAESWPCSRDGAYSISEVVSTRGQESLGPAQTSKGRVVSFSEIYFKSLTF